MVDLRRAEAFGRGHLPGSLNIPLDRSFPNSAGALLPDDQDLYLVVEDPCERCVEAAARDLARVGLDRVAGYVPASALRAWAGSGRSLAVVATEGPEQVRPLVEQGAVNVLDVRGRSEWQGGHLPGARHIPLVELPERLEEVPTDRPLVLQCGSGARSAIAASLVQRHGIGEVRNLAGGFAAWKAAGAPVVQDGEGTR